MQASAFVLHLARAEKRRENALKLKDDCGLEAELWPAIDGSKLSSTDLTAMVREQVFEPPYPFSLKTGEIGCFLSHRQVWAEIVRRELNYGLVFEDDVALDLGVFDDALDLGAQWVEQLGYVQLQNRPPRGAALFLDRSGNCTLTQPLVTPVRASAQLISRKAAKTLLKHSETFDRPVDTYVQSHWFTGLRPGVIYPSGVSTISDQLDGSTIQTGRKTIGERLRRELSRFIYRRAISRFSQRSDAPDAQS